MWAELLAGLGGAAEGAGRGLQMNQQFAQQERRLDLDEERLRQQAEIERMRGEIRTLIATMNEGGRNTRHETPSGSVTAQQEGANSRNEATNATRTAIAGQADETRRRGQDITQQLGMARDATSRRGQDFTFDTNVMRNNTANRRIDVTRELGMDRNAITRELGTERNAISREAEGGRMDRATAAHKLKEAEIRSRERIEQLRRERENYGQSYAGEADDATARLNSDIELTDEGTGRPTAQPVELEPKARDQAPPSSPEASADQVSRLETQARQKLLQFQNEQDPAKKKALQADLARIRDEIVRAREGGV